jgi:hypothetical protein
MQVSLWQRGVAASKSTAFQATVLFALTIAVLDLRRPDQFTRPYIWVEDGTVILKGFAERGWNSFFDPVNGYLISITKLITLTAFQISALDAPAIAFWLTVLFTAGTIIAVATSPTHLRRPVLCAVMTLLIPTDSEVFGISEYAFWWAGLLLALAVLWDHSRGGTAWRALFTIVGGLSSPLIIPFAGFFVLRALLQRTRAELLCAGVAVATATIQGSLIHAQANLEGAPTLSAGLIADAAGKFIGYYAASLWVDDAGARDVGVILVAFIASTVVVSFERTDRFFWILAGLLCVSWVVVLARMPIAAVHPFLAGPRYFFYPYIFLSWLLLWLYAISPSPWRFAVLGVTILAAAQGLPRLKRKHVELNWREQLLRCAASPQYEIPIHFNGSAESLWRVRLTGQQCRDVIQGSLIKAAS